LGYFQGKIILFYKIWVNNFLEKMEICKSLFGKNHGKLADGQNLTPKIFFGIYFHMFSLHS
jgi:hypothetical protein